MRIVGSYWSVDNVLQVLNHCWYLARTESCDMKAVFCCYYCVAGEEARKLFDDAQRMLSDVVNSGVLYCAGVVGFWRANSVGDDIEVYDDNGCVVATFHGLRQQVIHQHCQYSLCCEGHVLPWLVFWLNC